ncbi:MAG: flagellar biosynthetic protein FliO [Gammaproteobacteria bacterium]|nr:MAG: flagellar biosynthetic protein FliO [Gammaproteobacteria bacterium]
MSRFAAGLPGLVPAAAAAAGQGQEAPPGAAEALGATHLAGPLVQMLGGLVLVVGLILLFAWLARRLGGLQQSAGGQLRILGGLSMGTREKVVLIQVGEEQLLLGVAPGTVRTLHRLEKPLAVRSGDAGAADFATGLQRLMQGRKTT